jgi:hypothetical protein
MAYGFGTTVNPQLGATNYSGYLQGALSGAQMEAQGSAAIGQGIQNALGSIASGLAMRGERKEKMAERDRLLKEQDKMQTGQIKAAATIVRGLTMDKNMPDYVRNQAYQTLSQLDNPYMDTAEKFGIASQASETVKGLIGSAERETVSRNNEFLKQALASNTDTEGKVDVQGAFTTAVESGVPPEIAAKNLVNLEKLSPKRFTPEIQTLTDPDTGRQATVVTTSTGGAQVLPESAGLKIPAAILARDDKIGKVKEMRKLYEAGKSNEALDIAIGLELKNGLGQTPTIDDLAVFFNTNASPATQGAPSKQPVGRFTVTPK